MDKLQYLVNYIEQWRSLNGITGSSALSGDKLAKFVVDLQGEIAANISFAGEGTLVLYSGIDFNVVANYCENSNGQYYMISQTEAGNVLWEKDFTNAVKSAIGDEATATRILSGKETGVRINQYAIDGSDLLALDDFISQNVARVGAESGDVAMIIGKNATPNSVGVLTEIPEVLSQSGKGVSKLNILTDIASLDNGIGNAAKVNIDNIVVYIDEATGRISAVDMSNIIGGEPIKPPTARFVRRLVEMVVEIARKTLDNVAFLWYHIGKTSLVRSWRAKCQKKQDVL